MTKPIGPDNLAGRWPRPITETPGPPVTAAPGGGAPSGERPASVDVLDSAALAAIREVQASGESDLLSEMIEAFLEDAPAQLAQITDALLRSDARALAAAAHMLKSGAGYLGARELQRLCIELENIGLTGTIDDAQVIAEPLRIAFEQTRSALSKEQAARTK